MTLMIGSMSVHWWDAKVDDDDEKMIQTCQHGPVADERNDVVFEGSRFKKLACRFSDVVLYKTPEVCIGLKA
jgi:hypothetical protein